MSFSDLKVAELKGIAESFGVELPTKISKAALVTLLVEEGVSYADYERFANIEKEEIEPEQRAKTLELNNEPTILVYMERNNYSYQVNGVTFTKEHPYVALPQSFAQEIFDNHPGFRVANPREVQEFYS